MDCGALANPVNGSVDYTAGTTFRQTANYSCNTGYRLVGDNTQTRQATGNWSGSAPTCQSMLFLTQHSYMREGKHLDFSQLGLFTEWTHKRFEEYGCAS